jgi:hypothetical protein
MDTEKIILEMYGKTAEIASNVTHLVESHKCFEGKLDKLHSRVDKHDGYIKWGMGVCATIGVFITMMWEWIKVKWKG